ncbi:unnamed protein product [Didymodactylos carnosus]|uniref:NAD(P)(+)--arginine ADP-ribosyltransferase n=1 Tax=Didymodactylos carnosus TaxID=1234261 RepID=A0A815FC60_9BILA|nr:unnamed protein product [Didymodactylos carnosus]CAF1327213.1 unnamed protein product [Didymodactylos carnosus]CAF3949724.1 unnamed protein product [Didymodactylos carnosus]CAF4177834.1 unnamed protein product [Didymodactylos carnosus]
MAKQSLNQIDDLIRRVNPENRDLIRRDIIQAIRHPHTALVLKISLYYFNDGSSKDLLCLTGTVAVTFKGRRYNIPIQIWLTDDYPSNPPMCYVRPTSDMYIAVSYNVESDGYIVIPYLTSWRHSSSDLANLISQMSDAFGILPPVYSYPSGTNATRTPIEPNGSTALHVASYQGRKEIVELLLQKGANHAIINKYNSTPLEEAKTDEIKQLIITRRKNTRFCSVTVEWILATNDADYQAHEYWKKLAAYGKDPKFYQFIDHIKRHYVEKDLKEIDGIDTIRYYFDRAIVKRDPLYLITAYTADTGFYSTLNVHLAQLRLENLTAEDNLSRAYLIAIIARHPKFDALSYVGTTYRGILITNDDLKQYKIGTRILTKTFSSTSKEMSVARRFVSSSGGDHRFDAICIYEIRNQNTALDIEKVSIYEDEQEVLILPYSAFKIIDIRRDESQIEINLKECEPWA